MILTRLLFTSIDLLSPFCTDTPMLDYWFLKTFPKFATLPSVPDKALECDPKALHRAFVILKELIAGKS